MSNPETTLSSLQDLKADDFPKSNGGNEPVIVDLEEVDATWGGEDDEEQGKMVDEKATEVRKWVETHLTKLGELYALPQAVQDKPKNQEGAKKIRKRIKDYMFHPDLEWGRPIRRAAWVAVLVFELAKECKNYPEAMAFLDGMVKRGLLEENEDGSTPLYAWRRRFRIPETACFRRPEFQEVISAMEGFV